MWKLGIIFLLVAAGFYGYSYWAPLIIKSVADRPAAAAGVALVTMIANIGGFAGPALIGWLKTRTAIHTDAFLLLGGLAVIATLLAMRIGPARAPSSEQATVAS